MKSAKFEYATSNSTRDRNGFCSNITRPKKLGIKKKGKLGSKAYHSKLHYKKVLTVVPVFGSFGRLDSRSAITKDRFNIFVKSQQLVFPQRVEFVEIVDIQYDVCIEAEHKVGSLVIYCAL